MSKKAVLESELMVLKGLEFRVNDPNPLTYVEVLLEVLGKICLNTEVLGSITIIPLQRVKEQTLREIIKYLKLLN